MENIFLKNDKYNNLENSKFNYGLALLKSILAFSVVLLHTFRKGTTKNKVILYITRNRNFHVPSFFIMSFYFMSNNLLSLDVNIFLRRMMRLLIPYAIWPIIIWNIISFKNMIEKKKFYYNFETLKLQLLWGNLFMPHFWFQWNLIMITIFFFIIIFVFRKLSFLFLNLLLILSYISQYSGYYYNNFYLKYPIYNRRSISRLFEMIPFAVTGFNFGYYRIINILQKNKIKVLIYSLLIYNSIDRYNIFIKITGVSYYGVPLNIKSICIIFIFSLFPSNKIKNYCIKKFLVLITNYSAGVFYLHNSIGYFFSYFFVNIKKGTFLGIMISF